MKHSSICWLSILVISCFVSLNAFAIPTLEQVSTFSEEDLKNRIAVWKPLVAALKKNQQDIIEESQRDQVEGDSTLGVPSIVLDLDENLGHAVMAKHPRYQEIKAFVQASDLKHKFTKSIDGEILFIYRPHLTEFLDFIFSHFRVHFFTAAAKEYAVWVLNSIIPKNEKGKTQHYEILTREYCFFTFKGNQGIRPDDLSRLPDSEQIEIRWLLRTNSAKNLKRVPIVPKRTIFFDDLPSNGIFQRNSTILSVPYNITLSSNLASLTTDHYLQDVLNLMYGYAHTFDDDSEEAIEDWEDMITELNLLNSENRRLTRPTSKNPEGRIQDISEDRIVQALREVSLQDETKQFQDLLELAESNLFALDMKRLNLSSSFQGEEER